MRNLGKGLDGSHSIESHVHGNYDRAGDAIDRKSTSAYLFMMASGAICLCNRKRTFMAASRFEVENMALSAACKDAVWV